MFLSYSCRAVIAPGWCIDTLPRMNLPLDEPRPASAPGMPGQRPLAMADARRAQVLDAARRVFARKGVEGASIREIAREAGYTAGALYSYFESKEAIGAALLAESLDRLLAEVQAAQAPQAEPGQALLASARAWFRFYAHNPRDLDLGFHLVKDLRPDALAPSRDQALNQRLLAALRPCELALEGLGLAGEAAARENAALFAHGMGLLLLQQAGRLRLFGQDAEPLFIQYAERLVERLDPAWPARAVSQRDLFAD